MIKHLLVIFSSLYISSFADAQSDVDFGIKGGLNLTFFNVKEADLGSFTNVETSYYGGLFFDFGIDESFSIQNELLYIGLNDFKFINAPIYVKYEIANEVVLNMNYNRKQAIELTKKLQLIGEVDLQAGNGNSYGGLAATLRMGFFNYLNDEDLYE